MADNLHDTKLFNITQSELDKTKYPIFIGISVGVKPMSESIAIKYIDWALAHSDPTTSVKILVADEVARHNYIVLNRYTETRALKKAIRDGDKYVEFFQNIIDTHYPNTSIDIIRWATIKNNRFDEIYKAVNTEFETNEEFQKDIYLILNQYIARRKKIVADDDKKLMAQYLLEEFAVFLDGIYVNNINYRFIFYPTYVYSGVSQLISDIQQHKKYTRLGDALHLKPIIMIESLIAIDQVDSLITIDKTK